MAENILTLTVEKLAGLGDGLAMRGEEKIYVPHTLVGDVVRARIVRKTADATYAALEEVITPGPGRVAPVCRHFGTCGGCALQHMDAPLYRHFKQAVAEEAVRKAGFDPALVAPIVSFPRASRRRAEFKLKDGKLGYFEAGSHALVDIEECPVLEPELFALAMQMKEKLVSHPVTTLQLNGVDGGYDALIEGGIRGTPALGECPSLLRLSLREGAKVRTLYERAPVTMTFGSVTVNVPPGAFLQAVREAGAHMTAFIREAVASEERRLDLFSGLGAFAFSLADRPVTAAEEDVAMVAAMRRAASRHDLTGFKAVQRDLFRRPFSAEELKSFDAVILNPPRIGAKAQCVELSKSPIKKVVMVSCNPATFARDARLLREGDYRIEKFIPIDQFIYSPHLEIVAEFVK